jgi:hypothetical protein
VTSAPQANGVEWAEAGARLLTLRHQEPAEPDPERSILNLAESARRDDWTLRSALVRLAQPEPVLAGALLEVIRRCEGALQPLARTLERHMVASQPSLVPGSLRHDGRDWQLADDGTRRPEPRVVDLARLAGNDDERSTLLAAAYDRAQSLDAGEQQALGVLGVAVELDRLADVLAGWAVTAPGDPPRDEVDRVCQALSARLDRLGVPRETRPEL